MPSDSNGNYSLPTGYLATTGDNIETSQHNPPLEDIGSALTARLMRSGVAPMTGPLKITDGTASSPAIQLASASSWGWYKTSTGIGLAIGGVGVFEVGPSGVSNGNPPASETVGGISGLATSAEASGGVITHHLVVSGGSGTFTDGETVTATGGGSGVYLSATSSSSLFAIKSGTGAFTGTLTGSSSGATKTIGSYNPVVITPVTLAAAVAAATSAAAPRGYINGGEGSNNGSDVTNDIDISAGVCRDSTNAKNIALAAMTKKLDANWVAGTNQGFRNSAAGITDTTYWVYAVAKEDGTQDYYAHTSTTISTVLTALQAESGGSDYVYARRLFPIVRVSGAILPFVQDGDDFQLKTPRLREGSIALTDSSSTLTLDSIPNGMRLKARFTAHAHVSGATAIVCFTDLSCEDMNTPISETSVGGASVGISGSGISEARAIGTLEIWTNTSRQIRAIAAANTNVGISQLGWHYPREKN